MTVKELIDQLGKFPPDMPVHSDANGYDSEACPEIDEVKTETMIVIDGRYYPAASFPKGNIIDNQRYEVVLLS